MAPTLFNRRGLRPPRTPPATLGAPMLSRGRSSMSAGAAILPERGQRVAIDLAVDVLGDRLDDDDGGGHLEGRELFPAVVEQGRLRRAPPRAGNGEAHRYLPIYMVAHANRGSLGDVRMLEQAIGELQRRDVDPALDDYVLLSSGDVDVAVFVAPGEVAVAEAVLGNRHQRIRALPVGRRELTAADDHLTFLAGRKLAARVVEDAHAHVKRGAPDGAVPAVARMIAAHEPGLGAAGELH